MLERGSVGCLVECDWVMLLVFEGRGRRAVLESGILESGIRRQPSVSGRDQKRLSMGSRVCYGRSYGGRNGICRNS